METSLPKSPGISTGLCELFGKVKDENENI
jgi:hypothetical protein